MSTEIEMKRLAALGKMNAAVMIADENRFHWMTSSCHYSNEEEGLYDITIWTDTKEEAQLLLRVINRAFPEKKDSKIEELREGLFTLTLNFEY